MARVLTTVRVQVSAAHREAYLEAVGELAACHEGRGNHLWLFQLRGSPETYLECSEGEDGAHRARGPFTPTEARLEARLAALGRYPDENAIWDEVPLSTHP